MEIEKRNRLTQIVFDTTLALICAGTLIATGIAVYKTDKYNPNPIKSASNNPTAMLGGVLFYSNS